MKGNSIPSMEKTTAHRVSIDIMSKHRKGATPLQNSSSPCILRLIQRSFSVQTNYHTLGSISGVAKKKHYIHRDSTAMTLHMSTGSGRSTVSYWLSMSLNKTPSVPLSAKALHTNSTTWHLPRPVITTTLYKLPMAAIVSSRSS